MTWFAILRLPNTWSCGTRARFETIIVGTFRLASDTILSIQGVLVFVIGTMLYFAFLKYLLPWVSTYDPTWISLLEMEVKVSNKIKNSTLFHEGIKEY